MNVRFTGCRYPSASHTSLHLILSQGLLFMAAFIGFFFMDRAFCRGFCPVGMLLNAYGRGSMLVVRSGSQQKCSPCSEKSCVTARNRYKLDARSCPSLLNPAKLNSNSDCLVCGQCIKSCEPDNMKLFIRLPFHIADTREPQASLPLTLFVMLVSGFVTYELCTEWDTARQVFLWFPQLLTSFTGLTALEG